MLNRWLTRRRERRGARLDAPRRVHDCADLRGRSQGRGDGEPSTSTPTDDFAETELGRGDAAESGRATLATHVTISLSTPTSIALRCRRVNNSGSARTAVARETKLIAIKVGSITRTAVSG